MLTTQQARDAWGPPCKGARSTVRLFGEGSVSVRTEIVAAVDALDQCLRAHDYRTRKDDTGAYNCRKITGGTGYSLHAYGIALDLNWGTNPYGPDVVTDMPPEMVAAIKAIRTVNGQQVWRWGGDYSGNKDAMHFEVVCTPAALATGIDPTTVPGGDEEDEMPYTDEDRGRDKQLYAEVINLKQIVGSLQTGVLDKDAGLVVLAKHQAERDAAILKAIDELDDSKPGGLTKADVVAAVKQAEREGTGA